MFSYVFMKILEGRPSSYDRRMNIASAGRVLRIKRAVAEEARAGSHVLEIGCGTGELAAMLVERGCTVEAFDVSPAMVATARERFATESADGRVELRVMGVDGMDGLDDASFDVVLSTFVFSELTGDERRFALRHAARALKPGGSLVIAAEVRPRSPGRRALHALVRAPMVAATYLASSATTTPVPDLAALLEAAGFALERETRSQGDAFAIAVASAPRPGSEG